MNKESLLVIDCNCEKDEPQNVARQRELIEIIDFNQCDVAVLLTFHIMLS